MDKDILSVISRESPGFSKGQKLISKYLMENYDKAAFMTAGKLGEIAGVSESTVVRFAAELGYDGYPGMRKALQEMIRNRLTSVQRIEVARDLIDDNNIPRTILNSDIDRIEATLSGIDQIKFNEAVDMILGAERVYILGMRSSAALSSFMGFYLNLILENVHIVQDTAVSAIHEQILRIRGEDVFIGISYPRYSKRTLQAMKFAGARGAKVIGITDSENSPLAGIADLNLFARSDMVSFLDSLVAPLSLVNALIVSVGLRSDRPIAETFRALEDVWSECGIYEQNN